MRTPPRGFSVQEYRDRTERAQAMMREAGIDALLLTTEPEFRYFSGFLTRFWESPTRPWFLLLPCVGDPVAVIPSIGAHLMAQCWIEDVRTWRSPDPVDDGVSLLADAVRECVAPSGQLGLPMGAESHLRMPLADFRRLSDAIAPIAPRDDANIMRRLRMIKSEAEIEKISHACRIGNRAFARVGEIAAAGVALDTVFRRFQMLCLDEGADWVSYLAGGAGPDGYGDVISPASTAPMARGDIMMLDTGLAWDGYFCDFDRNYSIGPASGIASSTHARLVEAVEAGLDAARPDATTGDLFHAMRQIVSGGGTDTGRMGHGLGMQLTEWPSIIAEDETVLMQGMVLTLEPYAATRGGAMMVHEENIVVRSGKAQLLTEPQDAELPEV